MRGRTANQSKPNFLYRLRPPAFSSDSSAWIIEPVWLGLIAGLFVQKVSYIIAIGAVGFAILAIVTLRSTGLKRTALVTIASTLLTYTVGYLVSFVLVRFFVSKSAGG